ncbi:MAG: hypothetical protein V4549_12605 [Bacteroidota bacterium]
MSNKKHNNQDQFDTEEISRIEEMLKSVQRNQNKDPRFEDLLKIADVYFHSGELQQLDMIKHYKINGSELINAVFNDDQDKLQEMFHDMGA